MTCDVTFEGGKITDIQVTEESDSATGEWFASAQELFIPRVVESQSLSVDAITGATTSSNAIRTATVWPRPLTRPAATAPSGTPKSPRRPIP